MSIKNIIASSVLVVLSCTYTHAQTWGDVGGGVEFWNDTFSKVLTMAEYNNELYVSGRFDTAGTTVIHNIARWNGSVWDSVGFGFEAQSFDLFESFCIYNGELYGGGNFLGVYSGLPWPNVFIPHTFKLARWDGLSWNSLSNVDIGSTTTNVYALSNYNNELYVGGDFTNVGTLAVNRIAKWNGSSWSNVGGGVTGALGRVYSMAQFNGKLIVGGNFVDAGGIQTNFIAAWNGANWDSVGGGLNSEVTTMEVDTNANLLYVSGIFDYAGDTNTYVRGLAVWNGHNWAAIDTNIGGNIYAMQMYHGKLYLAGYFSYGTNCTTPPFYNFASWDGNQINIIPGPETAVYSLCVYHDSLFLGGAFDSVNSVHASCIASYYTPNTTLINESNRNQFFNIYPNPTKKEIIIELAAISKDQVSAISIYDMQGKLEREIDIKKLSPSGRKLSLNIEPLKTGSYIVELINSKGEKYASQKFVVE